MRFLFIVLCCVTALVFTSCTQEKNRPNILFIMSDDHAYQAVSKYRDHLIQTPNIDQLAEDGVLFTNCFVTNSICAPSRAVILSGQYSHLNGVLDNGNTLDGSRDNLAKILKEHGYETAIVGKWHLKSDPTGFDYWNVLPGQGDYYNPDFIELGEKKRHRGYVTSLTTDFAMDWLDKRQQEKPFFLMLHHKAPHRNWMPDTSELHLYKDLEFVVPENFFDDYSDRGSAAREQEMSIYVDMMPGWDMKFLPFETDTVEKSQNWLADKVYQRMDTIQRRQWIEAYHEENMAFLASNPTREETALWKYQRYMKDYLRCINSVDKNVGRITQYLKDKGLYDNTIIIYTSDQGFYLGEHGWFDKRFMYEESLRTPLLLKTVDNTKQQCIDKLVLNLDFAPTILQMAGIEVPDFMQGDSFTQLIGAEQSEWRNAIYYHYYEYPSVHMVKRHYGIRTERYKLIHFYYDVDEWEFYDLKSDSLEMNNQINNPDYQTIIVDLKDELYTLQKSYGDSDSLAYSYINKLQKND